MSNNPDKVARRRVHGATDARASRIAALGFDYKVQEKSDMVLCNLCGQDRWTVISHRDRYGYAAQATACQVCGLTMLNPRMTPNAYAEFYKSAYRPLVSAYHGRRIDAETVQEEQREYAVEMARFLEPYLMKRGGAKFLDVGGSTGVVAAHFARRFGFTATVLDPAPDEIAEAEALGITTVTSLVEDWEPSGKPFDIIGMFQTVDHLLDVRGTLKKLRQNIAPGGLLIMDIVDFRAACLKNWSVEAALKIDHPYSLTEETMQAYLDRAGFATLRKAYSADHHLVAFICRPYAPKPRSLPPKGSVERFMRELRFVQNTPAGSRCN